MQAMDWQTPSFQELDMSAEIGAYAPDMPAQDPIQRVVNDALHTEADDESIR